MNVVSDFAEDLGALAKAQHSRGPTPLLKRYKWFIGVVLLPTALSALYYGLIAADQYTSESRFTVKSPGEHSAPVSSLANLIQTTGLSAGQEETNEVLDYIRSRNALADLQERVDVKSMFSGGSADWLSRYPRLGAADRAENLYRFYKGQIEAHLDHDTGLAVLTVRAFSPADTQALNVQLLALSERLVNRLNDRARKQAISEAERRVAEAETRARTARAALGRYRNAERLIDPEKQSGGIFDVVTRLTAESASLQSQLSQMVQATPDNPAIAGLRTRIASLQNEIDAQSGRVVGNNQAIASKLANYEDLFLEQQFAAETVKLANASLVQAHAEAEKQQFYLERVVEPTRPDLSLYPHRLKSVMTIFGAMLCLYFIGWMLIVGILEHSPED